MATTGKSRAQRGALGSTRWLRASSVMVISTSLLSVVWLVESPQPARAQAPSKSTFHVEHSFSIKVTKQSQAPNPQPIIVTAKRVLYAIAGCREIPNHGTSYAGGKGWLKVTPPSNLQKGTTTGYCQGAKVLGDRAWVGNTVLDDERKTVTAPSAWQDKTSAVFQGTNFATWANSGSSINISVLSDTPTEFKLEGSIVSDGEASRGAGAFAFAHALLEIEGGPELAAAQVEWKPNLSTTGSASGVIYDPVSVRVLAKGGKVVRTEKLLGTTTRVKGGAARFRWKQDGSFEADADEIDWDIDMPSASLKQTGALGLSIRKGAVTRRNLSGLLKAASVPVLSTTAPKNLVTGRVAPSGLRYSISSIAPDQQVVLSLSGGGGHSPP